MSLCTAGSAAAQFSSDACTVSVLNRTVRVNPDGSWVLPNIPANFGFVRARVTCIVDGQTISGESEPFLVPANGVVNLPHINFGSTTPIPTSLTLTAFPASLTQTGSSAQLTAIARYTNGSTKDVTASSTGTQYTISNPAIATISAEGVVTAVQSGTVLIQATQEGASGITAVQVVLDGRSNGGIPESWLLSYSLNPNDPTIAAQDADRDGLTNLQEFQVGTNPITRDTDGDGLTDGDEVARGTSPLLRDTDSDGINDGLEIQTGSDPLNPNSYNLSGALSDISVTPQAFTLTFNTVAGDVSVQLKVSGALRDGTTIDLTAKNGVNYASNNLNACNFGAVRGRIFAGQAGSCTITITAGGFSTAAAGTVHTFAPTALSSLALGGSGNGIDARGDYVYAAVSGVGLRIVDVSNRHTPQIVGTLPLLGTATDVKVAGTLAYVAAGAAGLHIVDISNPLLPRLLGSVDTPGNASRVRLRGNLAIVADGAAGLQIVDIATASAPRIIGSAATPASANGVDIADTLAVVAVDSAGVRIVDITNPTQPVSVGGVDTPGQALDVVVKGRFAYVADYTGSLRVVNFTTPSAPVLGATTPPSLGGYLLSVAMMDSFVFGADIFFVNGVPIVDVSTPTNPISRTILNFPGDSTGQGIAVDGSYLYLVGDDGRLYIGQYRSQEDLNGIAPAVSISFPGAGATFVEGETIPVSVTASDDLAVASVTLLVDGALVNTQTSSPYQFNVIAPTGSATVTLGAQAVDLGNNVGVAAAVDVNVIPDPLTEIHGRVRSQAGIAGGASVTCAGLATTTLSDGTFVLREVSTVQPSITCSATLVNAAGVTLKGSSPPRLAVRAGITEFGDVVIAPVPVILSITPKGIDPTAPPASIQITGANLTGASFQFVPVLAPAAITIGVPQINAAGTSATLPITVLANARGRFTLVGSSTFGSGDSTSTSGNTLGLASGQDETDTDGDGFPDGLEVVLGSDPFDTQDLPTIRAASEVTGVVVSMLNVLAPQLTALEVASPPFAILNRVQPQVSPLEVGSVPVAILNGVTPVLTAFEVSSPPLAILNVSVPALMTLEATSVPFAILNSIGPQLTAFESASVPLSVLNVTSPQLAALEATSTQVSLLNAAPPQLTSLEAVSAQVSILNMAAVSQSGTANQLTSSQSPEVVSQAAFTVELVQPMNSVRVLEGQTIPLRAMTGSDASAVKFLVDGQVVATDRTAPFEYLVTVPHGVPGMTFAATAVRSDLAELTSQVATVTVVSDPGLTVSGRVVDGNGRPIAEAVVEVLTEGLQAEFFDFSQPLSNLPDLAGRTPDRTTRVSSLSLRNPNGVLGFDPFGTQLAPDYAARFTGWLAVSTPGEHRFTLGTHAGARLKVADTTVIDRTSGVGAFQLGSGAIDLDVGLVPIELTYYDDAGSSELVLLYAPPGGEEQVIAPNVLVPESRPLLVTTDALGQFVIPDVPTVFDGLRLRATQSVGGENRSVISERISPIPGGVLTMDDIIVKAPQ